MLDAAFLEERGQAFGLLDRHRANQGRLALGLFLQDIVDDRLVLLALATVDEIGLLDTRQGPVGRNDHDLELVDLVELGRLCFRGAGHAAERLVFSEVVLERDRSERLVFPLDLDLLFRLDSLM